MNPKHYINIINKIIVHAQKQVRIKIKGIYPIIYREAIALRYTIRITEGIKGKREHYTTHV